MKIEIAESDICPVAGKMKFHSAGSAMQMAHNFLSTSKGKGQGSKRWGDKINAYKCPHCGKFHWGHRASHKRKKT